MTYIIEDKFDGTNYGEIDLTEEQFKSVVGVYQLGMLRKLFPIEFKQIRWLNTHSLEDTIRIVEVD